MNTILDLCKLDDNLELVSGDESISISTISNFDKFTSDSLLFIGSKKFLRHYNSYDKTDGSESLVFDHKLWSSLEEVERDEISKKVKAVVTSTNLSLSISTLSKPFHDMVYDHYNFQVDGRKMGTAKIHPSVKLSENLFIGENVTIEADCLIMSGVTILPNSHIKSGTTIFPNVTIYPNVEIGSNCRIHAGTVVGADGFGYNHDKGVHHKVWHFGGVVIGDNVEIGTNVSIDQGTFSPTQIGSGSKLDNLIQIGHNVKIGQGVILCGQVGMAGSAKIGAYSVFGGKAAISDGIEIGQGVQVAGASIVTTMLSDGEKVGGYPARPIKEWMKGLAFVRKNSK